MTTKEIIQYVKDHPSGKVKLAIADIDGILRGKYISTEKFLSVIESGMGFCDVYLDGMRGMWYMIMYNIPDGTPVIPMLRLSLDIHTFRKIPWENDLPFFLAELTEMKGMHQLQFVQGNY